MLSDLQSVLEPFLLIALGYALSGTKLFSAKSLWDGVEKLVFWVLFPPLLFNSVAHASLSGVPAGKFLLVGTLAMAVGVLMAKVVSRLAPADPRTDASVRQTGYRFNSYICFALALNMYGEEVLALTALLTGVWVPISNALAVADLSMAADKEGRRTLQRQFLPIRSSSRRLRVWRPTCSVGGPGLQFPRFFQNFVILWDRLRRPLRFCPSARDLP